MIKSNFSYLLTRFHNRGFTAYQSGSKKTSRTREIDAKEEAEMVAVLSLLLSHKSISVFARYI